MDRTNYFNKTQQRILRVFIQLFGHESYGIRLTDIAQLSNISAVNATWDLANLQIAGLAEQDPITGRWRVSTSVLNHALRSLRAVESTAERFTEIKNRLLRG